MEDTTGRRNAGLLRHDGMIVANEMRAALSSWSDWLIALVVVVSALAAARSALSPRPFLFAATAIAALATAVGARAAWMIEGRLAFHAEDGVLAADAWAEPVRWHYALSVHAWVCVVVTICALIGRPTAAVLAPIGYLIGAGMSHVARRVVPTGESPRRSSPFRGIGPRLQRPIAGAVAAVPVVLVLLLFRSIEPERMAILMLPLSAVAALVLTMLDHHVVRFMTESGYSAGRIIGVHARSLLIFLIPTLVASLVWSDRVVTIVIIGVVLTALTFMMSRILAYRIHSKRTADTLVSLGAGLVSLTAFAMPMLLPLVVVAILWRLHRRSRPVTWLLA